MIQVPPRLQHLVGRWRLRGNSPDVAQLDRAPVGYRNRADTREYGGEVAGSSPAVGPTFYAR